MFYHRTHQFFEHEFLPDEESDELKLPKWVKVHKKRLYEILSTVTKAKKNKCRWKRNYTR